MKTGATRTIARRSEPAGSDGGALPAARQRIRANSVARALAILGDRWTLLVLGNAFLGVHRFGEWRQRLGIASNILADRLRRLVGQGCLVKLAAGHGRYRLTEKGRDLYPVALMEWWYERRWGIERRGQPAALTHLACGRKTEPRLVCLHCRAPVDPRDVATRPGPGAGFDRQIAPRTSRRPTVVAEKRGRGQFGESIEILGDRWSRLVVASVFLRLRRYDQMQKEWGIATNILTDRLQRLVANGLLQRRLYQTRPDRYEYLLTPKGLDLYPLILTMLQWGDRWLAGRKRPPLLLRHKPCGHRLGVAAVCGECGEELRSEAVTFHDRKRS
jgi:DNA-binding HxlR family transcriptional regulator